MSASQFSNAEVNVVALQPNMRLKLAAPALKEALCLWRFSLGAAA
jgi:hypothetical protein